MKSVNNIVLQLKGGLANQVYQYAALHLAASRLSSTYKIDISSYSVFENIRSLELADFFDVFSLQTAFRNKCISVNSLLYSKLSRRYPKLASIISPRQIVDSSDQLLRIIDSDKPANLLLTGYFIDHRIISSFLQDLNYSASSSLSRGLCESSGIAIHLRLGDYLNHSNQKIYPTLDSAYIKKAFNLLLARLASHSISPSHIKVFSDSPEIAEKIVQSAINTNHIGIPLLTDLETRSPSQLLRELSAYPYKILSPSTFSLLSYYLGANKLAIIPRKWFLDRPTNSVIFPEQSYNGPFLLL